MSIMSTAAGVHRASSATDGVLYHAARHDQDNENDSLKVVGCSIWARHEEPDTGFISTSECSLSGSEFTSLVRSVQEHVAVKCTDLVSLDKVKQLDQLRLIITKYVEDHYPGQASVEREALSVRLFAEMAEFSILTKYLNMTGVEEISINSWRDVKVSWNDGRIENLAEHFSSPQHALDVVRRLLHKSGMILDNARPLVRGHLANNVRITAIGPPVTDSEKGVAASIRIINPQKLGRDDFIRNQTATAEMLDFICLLIRFGVSTCITGATGSGKTTLMSWMLSTIPDDKRVFSIENGVREFDLVKMDGQEQIQNNVVHTVTRQSDDPRQNIDQELLLEYALTSNPDVICVGEMKSSEAFAAQEAARTGHTVVTTTHANSCAATYGRMMTLCKTRYSMDDKTLYSLVTEAFPVVVFVKRLEDGSRRIMEISECEIRSDGARSFRTLYQYNVLDMQIRNSRETMIGQFEKVQDLSQSLQKRLRENGMPAETLKRFTNKAALLEVVG